jgi:hypothetical protein
VTVINPRDTRANGPPMARGLIVQELTP